MNDKIHKSQVALEKVNLVPLISSYYNIDKTLLSKVNFRYYKHQDKEVDCNWYYYFSVL